MPWCVNEFVLMCMFDETKPIKSMSKEMMQNFGLRFLKTNQSKSMRGIIKIYQQQRIERPNQYIRKRINSITRVKSRSF